MILDFNLVLSVARPAALDERDRVINLLKDNGYRLLMTDDGTRVLMEKEERPVKGCGCACNSGGFCGGCGHAGCGGRRR